MSRGREPSYYEIALTQRQVVIAFVIVLLCLVAAFFSGVWVGGESARDRSVEPVAQTAQTDHEGAAATEPGAAVPGSAEPAVPTLRFFAEEEGESGQPANQVRRPAAGAQPGEAPPPQPRPSPPPQAPAAAPSTGAAPSTASSGAPIGGNPRFRPPAPRPRPSDAQESPPPPATTIPGQGNPVIQVFSSHDQAQAQKVLDRLLRADYEAFLSPAEVDGTVRFRVRVGPFESREEAERVAEDLRRDLKLETWITQ